MPIKVKVQKALGVYEGKFLECPGVRALQSSYTTYESYKRGGD